MILHYRVTTQPHVLESSGPVTTNVLSLFLGYSLTQVLLDSGLSSFDTVLHNSQCMCFHTFMAELLQCVSCIFK